MFARVTDTIRFESVGNQPKYQNVCVTVDGTEMDENQQ